MRCLGNRNGLTSPFFLILELIPERRNVKRGADGEFIRQKGFLVRILMRKLKKILTVKSQLF